MPSDPSAPVPMDADRPSAEQAAGEAPAARAEPAIGEATGAASAAGAASATSEASATNKASTTNEASATNGASEAAKEGDEKPASGEESSASPELIEPPVDASVLSSLADMGFGRNRSVRALHAQGRSATLDAALTWLEEHGEDAGVDEPLLVDPSSIQAPLSAEEARERAAELSRRARERRELEEKALERERERNRIRAGKELSAAARGEQESRLRRNIEARRLEKEEEARARAAIKAKLDEDRRERRRRLGLPEELTEEEKRRDAEKKAEKERARFQAGLDGALEATASAAPAVPPPSLVDGIRDALVSVKKNALAKGSDDAAVALCFATLRKLCANPLARPDEDKVRRVRIGPATPLGKRLLDGSVAVLELAGWEKGAANGDEVALSLPKTADVTPKLQAAVGVVDAAASNPFFGVL